MLPPEELVIQGIHERGAPCDQGIRMEDAAIEVSFFLPLPLLPPPTPSLPKRDKAAKVILGLSVRRYLSLKPRLERLKTA